MIRWRRAILGVLIPLVAVVVAFTTGDNAKASGEAPSSGGKSCVTCHGQPNIAARLETGETASLYVDPQAFLRSGHGQSGLVCADCHATQSAKTSGHPENARCQDCHKEGGKKPEKVGIVGRLPYSSLDAYKAANADTGACQACHPNQSASTSDQLHARFAGSEKVPNCNSCHTEHATEPVVAPYQEISRRCVDCHRNLADENLLRVHGHSSLASSTEAATCVQCHGVHKTEGPSKPVTVMSVAQKQCAACHADLGSKGGSSLASNVRSPDLIAVEPGVAVKVESLHSEGVVRNNVQQTCQGCHGPVDLSFDGLRRSDPRTVRTIPPAGLGSDPVALTLASAGLVLVTAYVGQDFARAGIESLRRVRSRGSGEKHDTL